MITKLPISRTQILRTTKHFSFLLFFYIWRDSPQWARASSFQRFLDHTQRRTSVGKILHEHLKIVKLLKKSHLFLEPENSKLPVLSQINPTRILTRSSLRHISTSFCHINLSLSSSSLLTGVLHILMY